MLHLPLPTSSPSFSGLFCPSGLRFIWVLLTRALALWLPINFKQQHTPSGDWRKERANYLVSQFLPCAVAKGWPVPWPKSHHMTLFFWDLGDHFSLASSSWEDYDLLLLLTLGYYSLTCDFSAPWPHFIENSCVKCPSRDPIWVLHLNLTRYLTALRAENRSEWASGDLSLLPWVK